LPISIIAHDIALDAYAKFGAVSKNAQMLCIFKQATLLIDFIATNL